MKFVNKFIWNLIPVYDLQVTAAKWHTFDCVEMTKQIFYKILTGNCWQIIN